MHIDILTAVSVAILLVLTSLWTLGVTSLFQEGMILERLGQLMDETLPAWMNKPFWRCPPCMASIHGSISYLTFLSGDYGLLCWPVFVICLAGLNYVIVNR